MINKDLKAYPGFSPHMDDLLGVNVKHKCEAWRSYTESNGMSDLWRLSFSVYYNAINDQSIGNRLALYYNRRDYIYSPVNIYKNIGKNFLNILYSKVPVMRAKAANTDPKVQDQIEIYNALIEYDYTKNELDKDAYDGGEIAWIFGLSFAFIEWNKYKGKFMGYVGQNGQLGPDPKSGKPVHGGQWELTNLSPFDVAIDPTKSKWDDQLDMVVRLKVNKFQLASQYKEFEDDILACHLKDWVDTPTFLYDYIDCSDDIFVYKYIHKAVPGLYNDDFDLSQGRYATILQNGVVIDDGPNDYDQLNIFPLAFNKKLYSTYGDSDAFDLLPIQKLYNVVSSCIATTITAFGIDKIVIPNTGSVGFEDLASGLKAIKMPPNMPEPKVLSLMGDVGSKAKLLPILERQMEGISAMNQVVRGDPEGLKSGVQTSIIEAKAIQYVNNAQKNAFKQMSDIANFILKLRQKRQMIEDIVPIIGEDKKFKMLRFSKDNIDLLDSIYMEPVDPLTNSIATRQMMADKLSQMGASPEEYVVFMKTGRYDRMIDDTFDELTTIQMENEKMRKGDVPFIAISDNDELHIKKHRAVLQDPDSRMDVKIVNAYNAHIKLHEDNQVTKARHQATLRMALQTATMPPQPPMNGPPGPPNGPMPPGPPPLPQPPVPPQQPMHMGGLGPPGHPPIPIQQLSHQQTMPHRMPV